MEKEMERERGERVCVCVCERERERGGGKRDNDIDRRILLKQNTGNVHGYYDTVPETKYISITTNVQRELGVHAVHMKRMTTR